MLKKKIGYFFCLMFSFSLILSKQVQAEETISIPEDVRTYCEKYAEEYELEPSLLMAICWKETRCRSNLENAGCKGICQISERFHRSEMELLGIDDLFDTEQNIRLCAYMLEEFADKNSDVNYILMCYNSGSSRGKKLYNDGVVTKYAKSVVSIKDEIERTNADGKDERVTSNHK